MFKLQFQRSLWPIVIKTDPGVDAAKDPGAELHGWPR